MSIPGDSRRGPDGAEFGRPVPKSVDSPAEKPVEEPVEKSSGQARAEAAARSGENTGENTGERSGALPPSGAATIVFHLGAPCTNEGLLARSLRREGRALFERGVFALRPGVYMERLTETLERLDGAPAMPEDQEALLQLMAGNRPARRVLFSNSRFLGIPAWMFHKGIFYHNAARRAVGLRNLFPENDCEFCLAISNPARFIPEVFATQSRKGYEEFMAGVDPLSVRWSSVIARLREACPDVPVIVWCDEDTPVIWGEVLARVSGLATGISPGAFDVFEQVVTERGMQVLRAFLKKNPGLSLQGRHRAIYKVLERHARPGALEVEIDLPGWNHVMVARMQEIYDEDIGRIAAIEGVQLIAP